MGMCASKTKGLSMKKGGVIYAADGYVSGQGMYSTGVSKAPRVTADDGYKFGETVTSAQPKPGIFGDMSDINAGVSKDPTVLNARIMARNPASTVTATSENGVPTFSNVPSTGTTAAGGVAPATSSPTSAVGTPDHPVIPPLSEAITHARKFPDPEKTNLTQADLDATGAPGTVDLNAYNNNTNSPTLHPQPSVLDAIKSLWGSGTDPKQSVMNQAPTQAPAALLPSIAPVNSDFQQNQPAPLDIMGLVGAGKLNQAAPEPAPVPAAVSWTNPNTPVTSPQNARWNASRGNATSELVGAFKKPTAFNQSAPMKAVNAGYGTTTVNPNLNKASNRADTEAARNGNFYKTGGMVRGPGNATSDSVPAHLSTGEAVLPVKTVGAMGGPEVVKHIIRTTNGKEPQDVVHKGGHYDEGVVPRQQLFQPPPGQVPAAAPAAPAAVVPAAPAVAPAPAAAPAAPIAPLSDPMDWMKHQFYDAHAHNQEANDNRMAYADQVESKFGPYLGQMMGHKIRQGALNEASATSAKQSENALMGAPREELAAVRGLAYANKNTTESEAARAIEDMNSSDPAVAARGAATMERLNDYKHGSAITSTPPDIYGNSTRYYSRGGPDVLGRTVQEVQALQRLKAAANNPEPQQPTKVTKASS